MQYRNKSVTKKADLRNEAGNASDLMATSLVMFRQLSKG